MARRGARGTIGKYSRSRLNRIIDERNEPGSGDGGAPTDAQYVVLAADSDLSAERILTEGTGITITDEGSTVTISSPASHPSDDANDILAKQVLGG